MSIKPTRGDFKLIGGKVPIKDAKASEIAWTKQMAPYHMRPLDSEDIVLSCFGLHFAMDIADLTGSKDWEILIPTAWAQRVIIRREGEDKEYEEQQMQKVRERGFHASVISDKDLWDKRITGQLRFGYADVFRLPAGRGKLPDTMPRHTHAILHVDDFHSGDGLIDGLCHGPIIDVIPQLHCGWHERIGNTPVKSWYETAPLDL